METYRTNQRRKRVKLIFNPGSGTDTASPVQLMSVITELQSWKFVPETYLTTPESDLPAMVRDTIAQGIDMFIVCGGDGTISAAARAIAGTGATLGIIPTGTQNNIALSLQIPTEIPAAIELLRTGRKIKSDIGIVTCGEKSMSFLEVCSVGLFTKLFSTADDIQHGDITQIGDLLAMLADSAPSEIRLTMDDKTVIKKLGHAVFVTNTPYVIRHYEVAPANSYYDGYLDVLFFADLSKLDLIGYVLKGPGNGTPEDSRIQHYRVKKIEIETKPQMPVMADGIALGEGTASIGIQCHAITVITGRTAKSGSSGKDR